MSTTSKSGRHAKGKPAIKSVKRKSSPLVAGATVAKDTAGRVRLFDCLHSGNPRSTIGVVGN